MTRRVDLEIIRDERDHPRCILEVDVHCIAPGHADVRIAVELQRVGESPTTMPMVQWMQTAESPADLEGLRRMFRSKGVRMSGEGSKEWVVCKSDL